MKSVAGLSWVAVVIAVVGCGGGAGSGDAPGPLATASVRAELAGGFAGRWVRVQGTRALPADAAYPCVSAFDACLPLSGDGTTKAVPNLCPSADAPAAHWSFSYDLYTDSACTTALPNVACVPHADEWLGVGENFHPVECHSRGAEENGGLCVVDPMTGAGRERCPEELRRVLVLDPTVWPVRGPQGDPSLVPPTVPIFYLATLRAIEELGFIPVVRNEDEWAAMTTADFAAYRAIVLADPLDVFADHCAPADDRFGGAHFTADVWGPAVDGNVLLNGLDVSYHADLIPTPGAYEVARAGIRFAAWNPYQTGLYVALPCGGWGGDLLPALRYFGDSELPGRSFKVQGVSFQGVRIVGRAEALSDLTDADFSGLYTPVHPHAAWVDVPTGFGFEPFAVYDSPPGTVYPAIIARGLEHEEGEP